MKIQDVEDMKLYWSNDFVLIGREPLYWMYQAESFARVARLAFNQAKEDRKAGVTAERWVDGVYKYLACLALENLLKAIMINDDKCLVSKRKIDDELKSHHIWTTQLQKEDELFKDIAENQLTEDERDLLEIAEHYVIWVGRYPIATNRDAYTKSLDAIKKRLTPPLPGFKALLSLDRFMETFEPLYFKLGLLAAGGDPRKSYG
jgi:hypothetical protein